MDGISTGPFRAHPQIVVEAPKMMPAKTQTSPGGGVNDVADMIVSHQAYERIHEARRGYLNSGGKAPFAPK